VLIQLTINWRVRQLASLHFVPQVFSSLLKPMGDRLPDVHRIDQPQLLLDVFIKQRDAAAGQRLQAHCSKSSLISTELGSLTSDQATFRA
jgi:hypothetical protein